MTKKSIEQILSILREHGKRGFEYAQNFILREKRSLSPIYKSLMYFVEQMRSKTSVFPALISLSCHAVGGNPDVTPPISAAIILLTGAADVHDDLIDKSKVKYSKQTIYGKFGEDIALLVGDALLLEGLTLLFQECSKLSQSQSGAILNSVKQALLEIGSAETLEIKMRGRYDISPEEYYGIVKMKAAFAEACTRIGAILGNGSSREIKTLAYYGRIFGILTTLRDDFIDVYELEELQNRLRNECIPLPIICALQNKELKERLLFKLEKLKHTGSNADVYEIAKLVMNCREVRELKRKMKLLALTALQELRFLRGPATSTLKVLLYSTMEGL
mgnify:CR=1 FL=1